MNPIKTLRVRFALWTTALILALLVAFGTFVYFSLSRSLNTAVDDSLAVSAAQAAGELNVQHGQLFIPESLTAEDSGIRALIERGLTVIIMAKDGSVLQSAGPYCDMAVPIIRTQFDNPQGTYLTLTDRVAENDALRVCILPALDNGQVAGYVQVIQSLGPIQDALTQLLTALLLGGTALLLFAALGGYFLAARALRPIDRITQTAQQIAGGEDLSARLHLPDTGDEVSRLAATFDAMLARLEDSFRRERQFTADASHELRTPLTAMQAILSVTRQRKRNPTEYEQALDDLSAETERLRSLTESLLTLARGDLQPAALNETIDLSTLLEDVTESLRPLAEAKGLELACETESRLTVRGESDGLIRLFINLLDNAIKYTEHGRIEVSARRRGAQVHIEISDSGIGIPASGLPHIFERFYQVEQSRSKSGSGLGLALAQQIVTAHGGTIAVASQLGKGSTFSVELPYFS